MDTPKPRPRRAIRRRPARSASAPAASPRGRAAAHAAPAPDTPETPQPEPLAFETLGFAPVLLEGIRDRGFTQTTPIQTVVLPLVRGSGDLIACAETGTGKTAAFVLPLLDRMLSSPGAGATGRTRILILTPTRELASQIDDDIQGFAYHAGISSMAVYGGVPMEPQSRALTAGVPLVVATPGRLMDHMRSGTAAFSDLEVLVLDEADRMLDMGFWPDVRRIVDALPAQRQTLLFSATMPNEIMSFAHQIMREPQFVQVGRRGGPARTITHAVENVPSGEKTEWLARFLRGQQGPVLVFVRTKRGCERLAQQLTGKSIRAAALHADRSQKERQSAVEGFRSGRIRVLVATDIAARGLDIDGITHVVNYDVPHTPETYVHRVGRTGRALATGTAVTLVSPGEERQLRAIADHVAMSA